MADTRTVRTWARESGHPDAKERGNLGSGVIADWDAAHPDDPYRPAGSGGSNGHGPAEAPRAGTMTAEQMEELFGGDDGFDSPDDLPGGDQAESRPRPVPRARKAPGRGGGLAGLLGGKKQDGKARGKKKPPRVSTEDFIGAVWRAGARLATPLPPLYRVLRVQAPVAGILLEDAVRDTAADTVLQPFARLAAAGETVNALLGPPLYVTGLTLHASQAAAQGRSPNPLVMSLGVEGLRSSLMAWMHIAGPKFAQALEREREFEEKYGAQVDEFIGWLLSPAPSTEAEAEAEEMMFARATGQHPETATM